MLWQQLGVRNEAAAAKARAAGLETVMDRCVKIEHGRLFGGLNWVGVNTKVISAKAPPLAGLLRYAFPHGEDWCGYSRVGSVGSC